MKTFTHVGKNHAYLARPELAIGHQDKYMKYKGEVYEIIEVEACSGRRTPWSKARCRSGGDPDCPGKVKLDRPPFNMETNCWCWQDKSIFDFYTD